MKKQKIDIEEKIANDISDSLSKTLISITKLFKNLKNFFNNILDNDTHKKHFEELADEWAKYNLCQMFNAPLKIFINKPKDENEIYNLLDIYSTNRELNKIFNKIENILCLNSADVKEMIFLYKEKRYKSCIMLLFSFIDCIIISLQDNVKNKKLPSKIADIELHDGANFWMFQYYEYQVLTKILGKVYESGKDFAKKEEFILLNRNYIQHGVSTRDISKYDCLKMMYLVISVQDYFTKNILNEKSKLKKKLNW